eukprot:866225-Pleurochrysis_carterae.AAC.4
MHACVSGNKPSQVRVGVSACLGDLARTGLCTCTRACMRIPKIAKNECGSLPSASEPCMRDHALAHPAYKTCVRQASQGVSSTPAQLSHLVRAARASAVAAEVEQIRLVRQRRRLVAWAGVALGALAPAHALPVGVPAVALRLRRWPRERDRAERRRDRLQRLMALPLDPVRSPRPKRRRAIHSRRIEAVSEAQGV